MSVFLLILKIIGIALLVILGLIVVIALLALFCPFVYRVKGSYHEKNLQLQVRIWWPFFNRCDAVNYGRTLKDTTVVEVTNQNLKA